MVRCRTPWWPALGVLALAACSKSEPAPGAASSAAPVASAAPVKPDEPPQAAAATATATAEAPASTGAAPAAPASKSAAAAPKAEPTGAATAAATTTPAKASGPKTFACGDKDKGQAACPTQAWMKANMAPAVASEDGPAIAKGLDYIAAHAPAGMPNWSSISKAGATKARAGDIAGAKATCKTCHDQYKAKYKSEMRDRSF